MSEPTKTEPGVSIASVALSLFILAAGAGGFFWMGTPQVETRPPQRPDSAIVETSSAIEHTDGIEFVVDGLVVPFKQIQIAAQVGGRVLLKSPQCLTGRNVRKGDLLIQIDPKDYELEATLLKEELAQADAMIQELDSEVDTIDNQIASAKKQVELDDRQLKRTSEIYDRRAASETELDTAKRAALGSRSNLQNLEDQKSQINQRRIRLESAKILGETNLEKAKLALSRTEIRSPIDGIVVSENVEQDGYLQTGSTVIVLQDTSQLDVTCQLHMRQMNWLWQSAGFQDSAEAASNEFPATPAEVTYDLGGKTFLWSGVLDRFDGAGIDNQTRMVPCRVHIDRPTSATLFSSNRPASGKNAAAQETNSSRLKPPQLLTGMFVKVRVRAKPPISLVRFPQKALQPGDVVWAVADGKLVRKKVEVAASDDQLVIAYQQKGPAADNGLQEGDQIVVSPLATPVEGMKVTLLEEFEKQKTKPGKKQWAGGPPNGKRPASGPAKGPANKGGAS